MKKRQDFLSNLVGSKLIAHLSEYNLTASEIILYNFTENNKIELQQNFMSANIREDLQYVADADLILINITKVTSFKMYEILQTLKNIHETTFVLIATLEKKNLHKLLKDRSHEKEAKYNTILEKFLNNQKTFSYSVTRQPIIPVGKENQWLNAIFYEISKITVEQKNLELYPIIHINNQERNSSASTISEPVTSEAVILSQLLPQDEAIPKLSEQLPHANESKVNKNKIIQDAMNEEKRILQDKIIQDAMNEEKRILQDKIIQDAMNEEKRILQDRIIEYKMNQDKKIIQDKMAQECIIMNKIIREKEVKNKKNQEKMVPHRKPNDKAVFKNEVEQLTKLFENKNLELKTSYEQHILEEKITQLTKEFELNLKELLEKASIKMQEKSKQNLVQKLQEQLFKTGKYAREKLDQSKRIKNKV